MIQNRYEIRYDADGLVRAVRLGLYRVRVKTSGQVLASYEYGDRAESERVRWEGDYIADVKRYGAESAVRMAVDRETTRRSIDEGTS